MVAPLLPFQKNDVIDRIPIGRRYMKSPRRPSPSRGLKDFVIVCRHERRPPQSRRPPAHRYPATPRRRHDRLRRTRKPVVHCSVYKDPPLWYLQRLWYLQSARYAQDGAKLNAGPPPGPPAPVTGHCAPLSATPPASPSWAIASKGSNEGGCQPRPCAGAT